MRAVDRVVFVALLLAPTIAGAEKPKPTGVFENRVINRGEPRPQALQVSRKLYLNDCKPNGCVVTKTSFRNDSSLTNRSSIPAGVSGTQVTLDAYMWPDAHWQQLVTCVQETFKPFNIEVVLDDPGSGVAHHEVMIGGTSRQLNPNLDAGGVAPFIDCGATQDNGLSFVFANQTSDIYFLCGAVAQEACHVWGLDHELDGDDPLTYLDLGSHKTFQNNNADCGEDTPRSCECSNAGTSSGSKQNSFNFMRQQFGLSPSLEPTTITLLHPVDGQFVPPKFAITATYQSPLAINSGSLSLDGQPFEQIVENSLDYLWSAPATLPAGQHMLTIAVVDEADRTSTQSITVNVLASCAAGAACPSDTVCFNELCQALNAGAGGLGGTCTDNLDCVTGTCASDGSQSLCTGACEAGSSCPAGFECLSSNLCWPEPSGGCSTMNLGGNGPAFLLLALAGLLLGRRRRR